MYGPMYGVFSLVNLAESIFKPCKFFVLSVEQCETKSKIPFRL